VYHETYYARAARNLANSGTFGVVYGVRPNVKRLGTLLFLMFSAGVAGSAGQPVAAAKEPLPRPAAATAALAIVGGEAPKLVWLNPRTLKPLKRGVVALGGSAYGTAFSPTGGRVAIGSSGSGVRIVDVFRMERLARVARLPGNWGATPLSWPAERRLLVLEFNLRTNAQSLLVIDPVSRRVVTRRSLPTWTAEERTGRELAVVTEPAEGIGSARLLVVDPNGAMRSVVLDRIPAGGQQEGDPEQEGVWRIASPGLAVDPVARRAYVIGQAPLLAEIDLDSLAVTYRELSQPVSLLGRLRDWLEPAAHAKIVSGWHRQAVSLGEGRLAVAGSDYDRLRRDASGLELIDVQTGTMRRLEGRASYAVAASGLLLVAGDSSQGDGDWTGMGVAAYTLDGDKLWHVLDGAPVSSVQTAGGYAYVVGEEVYPQTVRVIDLATGAVRSVRGEMPYFVTG